MTSRQDEENQAEAQDPPSPVLEDQAPPPEPEPVDPIQAAEKVKEQGNALFKAGKLADAIQKYTGAIDLNPNEPTYLTNRAAAYMGLKKFKPALADCQQAATLQAAAPSVKTLTRLARCQLSTGSTAPALSTLRTVLELEPKNAPALQLQKKVLELEAHLRNFDGAKGRKDWGMARLALEKCMQSMDAEGGDIPLQWRLWRVELEIARGQWDSASMSANDAYRLEPNSPDVLTLRGLLMFLTAKTAQALQHAQSALRLDPGHEPAMRLRKRVRDVDRLKDEGNAAFKAGRLDEATAKYGEALEKIGQDDTEGKGGHIRAMLLSNRATTLLKVSSNVSSLERFNDALADTEASIDLNSQSFKVYRTRARIQVRLEKYEAAIQDFKTAIEQAEFEGCDSDAKALKTELRKAEVDLKRSKSKDYYKILGVSRECTEVEIKKAYRRESLKHHPDKGGDEEKFKLVAEAHTVLSNPQTRQRYDLGEDDEPMGGMGGGMGGMDFADLFAHLHSQGSFGGSSFGGSGFGGGFGGGGGYGGRQHYHSQSQGFPF
ncbi:hypothetical protein PHLGIDRAFT_73132 [Phlebiopsis gigantea 11061_1 CR5-6]|uniref:J domain-containing protein n=1 Tax=Phlebiopsis gigantea (strain 11061_1 CR5-6) TaxID=745531 RepID=A0A0C3S9F8_PHLG1|nr:hypothetical protein PHLGIDRAFT_73132 [Phlebiopsis gigantea 11061_1 CR5-6]